ncbi:MAG: hypothetical protein OQJ97_06050 [Rhodospirillales bacterium]|nr:hypothetical protein [Rhodospirillales bacterium]
MRGTQFIGLVKGKTLSGKNTAGVKFHLYFLRGGIVTYMDKKGSKDTGKWYVKDDKYICVRWQKMYANKQRCASAYYKDRKIIYHGMHGSGEVDLLAYIADGFK